MKIKARGLRQPLSRASNLRGLRLLSYEKQHGLFLFALILFVLPVGLDVSVSPLKPVSWSNPLVTLSGVSSVCRFSLSKLDKIQQQHLRLDQYPHFNRSHPNTPSYSSRRPSSRFAHPNSFACLSSSLDSDEDDDVSDSSSSVSDDDHDASSSVFPPRILPLVTSPFADLDISPISSPAYRVSYDTQGLPVTVPLPFSYSQTLSLSQPSTTSPSALTTSSVGMSAILPSSPLIADSGCTGLLIELSNLACLTPFFAPYPLSLVPFTLPDGSSLSAGGPTHVTRSLSFPNKRSPVSCYFLPASDLSHSLFGVSPLIRPYGHAIFTTLSCSFFDSPTSTLPFLNGRKTDDSDLWHLSVPHTSVAASHSVAAPLNPPSAFFSLQSLTAARFVAYWHRAFDSPSLSTFLRALKLGYIHGIPLLTPKLVSKYPPLSLSTSFSHLDTLRKGIASTRKKSPPASCLGPVARLSVLPPISPRTEAFQSSFPANASRASTVHHREWSAADLTGRFPIPSHLGYEYVLIVLHFNYIHFVPLKSRTSASYLTAYRSVAKFSLLYLILLLTSALTMISTGKCIN